MMNSLIYVCVVLAIGGIVDAQKQTKGSCPTVVSMSNFVFDTFTTPSSWFEMGRYSNTNQTTDSCSIWKFYDDVTALKFEYTGATLEGTSPPAFRVYTSTVTLPTSNIGTFSGSFPWSNANIHVLNTDYTSYAVLYSCSEYNVFFKLYRNEYVWVLQRDNTATPSFSLSNIGTAAGVTIDTTAIVPTVQGNPCEI